MVLVVVKVLALFFKDFLSKKGCGSLGETLDSKTLDRKARIQSIAYRVDMG